MVTLELCLDLGLIPSTRSFKKVFDDLPFDLKILSRNGSLYHQTKVAGPLNANAVNRANHGTPGSFRLPDLPDSLFIVWPLSGGTALLTQDMSGLNELNRTLGKQGTELKRDLEALEHDRELVELLTELEVKSRLVDDVDAALSASMAEVTALLNNLPTEPHARQRQLACDLRAVGIDCAALVNLDHPVAAQQASTLYDCIYDMAFMAFECSSPALIYHLGERDDGLIELRAHLQSDDEEDLSSLPRTQALRERLDKCDVIYALTGNTGQLVLLARVKGGECV